jgi:cysteine desulfurase
VKRIYLDHHATTPLLFEVRAAMAPYLDDRFGNPSSEVYPEGREAAEAVERARAEVAELVGARPSEVVFTSGATEADNWAIKGTSWERKAGKGHIVTCAIEHKAVLEPTAWLEKGGIPRTVVPVDAQGLVSAQAVVDAIREDTHLVAIQHANSEVGTIQPVEEIGRSCRERGVLFLVDAAQTVGKIDVRTESLGADLLAISAHKLYGPKGVGALVIRRGLRLTPLVHGGGQEKGRRSGTLHVAGIVGFGAACRAAVQSMAKEGDRLAALRDRLWELLSRTISGVLRNGDPARALPHNLNVSFEGVYAQALIQALKNVSVSSGSACSSANPEPSYVLLAMGISEPLADAAIRFGLGRDTTAAEIDTVAAACEVEVAKLRALSPTESARSGA